MSPSSFMELQARYVAGESISSEEAGVLLQWLHDHPGDREAFMIDDAIDNQLRCLARINDEALAETFVLDTIRRAVATKQVEIPNHVIQTREKRRSHPFQLISVRVGLCTALLFFVGIALAWYSTVIRQQDQFGFAHITNTKNMSWELVNNASRRLRITSGSGEIHFENGTIAQLAAPAVIELQAPSRLFVNSGSVSMSVPPAAVGFAVETPVARIVDYGTKFDVDVERSGHTATRVRSGIVTFETHLTGLNKSAPIKLTADGLNHASAVVSELPNDVRSVTTTASGSQGQFFGTIHVDGESAAFGTRQELEDFQNRLNSSMERDPSQFREQWKATVEATANSTSTTVESREGSDESEVLQRPPAGRAREMMIDQLRTMRELNEGNQQMQDLLERMIEQAEADGEKTPE